MPRVSVSVICVWAYQSGSGSGFWEPERGWSTWAAGPRSARWPWRGGSCLWCRAEKRYDAGSSWTGTWMQWPQQQVVVCTTLICVTCDTLQPKVCFSPALLLRPAFLLRSDWDLVSKPLGQVCNLRLQRLHLHITCRLLWLQAVNMQINNNVSCDQQEFYRHQSTDFTIVWTFWSHQVHWLRNHLFAAACAESSWRFLDLSSCLQTRQQHYTHDRHASCECLISQTMFSPDQCLFVSPVSTKHTHTDHWPHVAPCSRRSSLHQQTANHSRISFVLPLDLLPFPIFLRQIYSLTIIQDDQLVHQSFILQLLTLTIALLLLLLPLSPLS